MAESGEMWEVICAIEALALLALAALAVIYWEELRHEPQAAQSARSRFSPLIDLKALPKAASRAPVRVRCMLLEIEAHVPRDHFAKPDPVSALRVRASPTHRLDI